jgi:hypothetical protein
MQNHPHNLAMSFSFLIRHGLGVHVHRGSDVCVPQEFLLHFQILTIGVEQRRK